MFSSFNARALGLDLPPEEAIDLASAAGFDGIDLMVRDLVDAGLDPRELRKRIDDRGLRPGAWPLAIDWRDAEDERFRRDLARLPRYAEAAAVLGLTRTGTWVRPDLAIEPGEDPAAVVDRAFRFHRDRLGAIAQVLGASGIRLGLEVLGVESLRIAGRPVFIARMGEPLLSRLLDALEERGEAVGLLLDLWHLYAAAETPDDLGPRAWERIVWVHVADLPIGADGDRRAMIDTIRGLPGEHGAIPIRHDLARLQAAGYAGPVTVEPLPSCASLRGLTAPEIAAKAIRALNDCWPGRGRGEPSLNAS